MHRRGFLGFFGALPFVRAASAASNDRSGEMAWIEYEPGLVWGVPPHPGLARFAITSPRPALPDGVNFIGNEPNVKDSSGAPIWHRLNVANCGVPSGAKIVRVAARLSIGKDVIDGSENSFGYVRMVGNTQPHGDHLWKARAMHGAVGVREDSFAVDIPLVNDEFEFCWETSWNASSTDHPIGGFTMMFLGYFR